MKRLSMALSIALLLTLSAPAPAANVWVTNVDVKSVKILENGTILLLPDPPVPGCDGGQIEGRVGKSEFTRNAWKATLSMLLAAGTLAKQVDVMYNDKTSRCWMRQVLLSF